MGKDASESILAMPLQAEARTVAERGVSAGEFLRKISTGLHDLSQPMTVLLCLAEYGSSLEASDELKQVMVWSAEAIERLRVTVIAMQSMVQDEGQRTINELTTSLPRRERSFGQQDGHCGEHGLGVAVPAPGEPDESSLAGARG